jgi:hypothetical protein
MDSHRWADEIFRRVHPGYEALAFCLSLGEGDNIKKDAAFTANYSKSSER